MASKASGQGTHECDPVVRSHTDDFYFILLRAIESTKEDPAQLRKVVYELARAKLQREAWSRNPPVSILEMRRYIHALDAAIERIESPSLQEDELESLLSRMRLIGEPGATPRSAALVIHHESMETGGNNAVPVWLKSEQRVPALTHVKKTWVAAKPLVQTVAAAVIAVTLFALLESNFEFGIVRYGPHRAPVVGETAPTIRQAPAARNEVSSEPERTASVQMPVLPLPTLYGVYAISDGQLRELEQLPIRVPDQKVFISPPITTPSRTTLAEGMAKFVAFRRDLVTGAPERVTIRVVAKVRRSRTFNALGKPTVTNVDDVWAVRSNSYEFRVAPLSQSSEMIIIRPESDDFSFPAGRYALMLKGQAYDFNVDGPITDAAQCLERTEALNGPVYSGCQEP